MKVLKCSAGEGSRRSVGPIVWEMKKCYITVKEERNILHTVKRRKTNWIGHILCRNCLLEHVFGGKSEGTRRLGRRRKQLLDNLKEKRWYWNWKEGALDRTLRRNRLGTGCGQTADLCFVTGLRDYPICVNLDESPWLTGWLMFSYLNFRSDFPMPHPETPYNHGPVDQYQAKKGFGKHVFTSFYGWI